MCACGLQASFVRSYGQSSTSYSQCTVTGNARSNGKPSGFLLGVGQVPCIALCPCTPASSCVCKGKMHARCQHRTASAAGSSGHRPHIAHQPSRYPAQPTRRSSAASALPIHLTLLFLPWNGCDKGGFYGTGKALKRHATPCAHNCECLHIRSRMSCIHTAGVKDNCQEVYQPAAAAEARFARRLLDAAQQVQAPALTPSQPEAPATTSGWCYAVRMARRCIAFPHRLCMV